MVRGTVLVVDADPIIVAVLTAALEDAGYGVLTAVNGGALPVSGRARVLGGGVWRVELGAQGVLPHILRLPS